MLDIPRFDRPSRRFCMPQSHEPFLAVLAELPTCLVWLDMRSTFSSFSQAARAGGGNDHDRPERELSADVLSESAPIPGSSVAQANSSKGQGTGPWDAFICARTTVCCTHTACKLQHSGCQSPQMQTSHMSSWQYCSPQGIAGGQGEQQRPGRPVIAAAASVLIWLPRRFRKHRQMLLLPVRIARV